MFDVLQSEVRVFAEVNARRDATQRRIIGSWLLCVAALIMAMVVVGGATRLTGSGLSMVDWRPVTGFIPPLSEADWAAEFTKYKRSPEYQQVNAGMSLEAFKGIYHWEFWHRNLGRFIGLAFGLPLLFFILKRWVPGALMPRLLVLLVLGGAQGGLGWFMVQSGLTEEAAVSHYRLAAHLSLALLLFCAVFWTALDLLTNSPAQRAGVGVKAAGWMFAGFLALQIVYGAFVAGLDAGYYYNTWPDMDGDFLPPDAFAGATFIEKAFDSIESVQFIHRGLAYTVAFFACLIAWFVPRKLADSPGSTLAVALSFVVLGQVVVGILTLLNAVPVWLGTLHQGWAVVLIAVTVAFLHRMKTRRVWA